MNQPGSLDTMPPLPYPLRFVLVALAGHSVARLEDVHSQLHGEAIGKPLALKFVRGGATQEVNIVVGERPRGGE